MRLSPIDQRTVYDPRTSSDSAGQVTSGSRRHYGPPSVRRFGAEPLIKHHPWKLTARFALLCLAALGGCGDPIQSVTVTELPVPAAPGSRVPRLGGGGLLPVVLSWVEPDGPGSALRVSVLGDSGWGPPKKVAGGYDWLVSWADTPAVAPLSDSVWGALWIIAGSGDASTLALSVSKDRGGSWGSPITPHDPADGGPHGFASLFPDAGGMGVAWLDGRHLAAQHRTELRATKVHGGEAAEPEVLDGSVCDCCATDSAVSSAGPLIAYRGRSNAEIRDIFVSRRGTGGDWQPGHRVAADDWQIVGCPINGPAIDAAGERVAVAWFSGAGGIPRVAVGFSSDGARSFDPPRVVATQGALGRVDVVLTEDGDALVSWLETGGPDGATTEIRIRRVGPNSMGRAHTVAVLEERHGALLPRLVRQGGTLVLAWPGSHGGGASIRSVRLSADAVR